MKRKAYTISGQSFTKPTDLPEGLEVVEAEVFVPASITVPAQLGERELTVSEHEGMHGIRFGIRGNFGDEGIYIELDSARQVRDCLNAILGDEPKRRVYRNPGDDWAWWETKPGFFTYNSTWDKAKRESDAGDKGCVDMPFEQMLAEHSPISDVTSQHPEVTA